MVLVVKNFNHMLQCLKITRKKKYIDIYIYSKKPLIKEVKGIKEKKKLLAIRWDCQFHNKSCGFANCLFFLLSLYYTCARYSFCFWLHDSWSRWVTGVAEGTWLIEGEDIQSTSCLKVKSCICFFSFQRNDSAHPVYALCWYQHLLRWKVMRLPKKNSLFCSVYVGKPPEWTGVLVLNKNYTSISI